MYKPSTEIIVGIFVTVGLLCFGYLSINLGEATLLGDRTYRVSADFDSVTGLQQGASVEIAGVPVGKVLDITLHDNLARVTMEIRNGVRLSKDSVASIRTKGIIGDMFVKLSPGGSAESIPPNGTLVETEPAISIEELISKYIFEKQ